MATPTYLPQPAVAGDDIIVKAREAAVDASKAVATSFDSAIGSGDYTVVIQDMGENEPKLWSKAKIHVYFDRGKYHIQLVYEKKLVRVSTVGSDKAVERIADGKYDDVRIIADDDAVYVVNFSERIRPTGCGGEIFAKDQIATAGSMAGFEWREPAQLWKDFPDVDKLIQKAGADAVTFSDIGEGRFRGKFPIGNSTADFDIDQSAGFHVTTFRAFNPKQQSPVQRSDAKWEKIGDTWYVKEITKERDNREVDLDRGRFSRATFKYDSFEMNVKVEPDLFTLKSVMIPVKTRFIDRRKNPASQFHYWNGMSLQTDRL
jgi:hypothetical protein